MLKQIKYFQTVVRAGSFSKAADQYYISQSAISQQVQALKRELKKICKGVSFGKWLAVYGADAAKSESTVAAWAKKSV